MSLRINTNVTAMNALRNLEGASDRVATSIERLSSGMRINRAADDPAGLIISESLRSQMDGLNQAISNSQDATNLIKTAEGALTEVNTLLRNIRQLAVHAANTGVNDQIATQADQAQIASAIASVQRIAEQTQFGTKRLLDGTSGISAAVVDTKNIEGIYIGGVYGGVAAQTGTVNITVNNASHPRPDRRKCNNLRRSMPAFLPSTAQPSATAEQSSSTVSLSQSPALKLFRA